MGGKKGSKHNNCNSIALSIDPSLPESHESFEELLQSCQEQLLQSDFWASWEQQYKTNLQLDKIICYGIGNFYTRRPSAPLWQLALALLIASGGTAKVTQRQLLSESVDNIGGDAAATNDLPRARDDNRPTTRHSSSPNNKRDKNTTIPMYFFDPKMTDVEAEVLKLHGIHIIPENERACRRLETNMSSKKTLFFMPHCGVRLYTNLLWTNWQCLDQLIIFGNSLQGYLDQCDCSTAAGQTGTATVSQQPHCKLLQLLRPHWIETSVCTSKNDRDSLHHFENAFNNSGTIAFASSSNEEDNEKQQWPERPMDYDTIEVDTSGEVL